MLNSTSNSDNCSQIPKTQKKKEKKKTAETGSGQTTFKLYACMLVSCTYSAINGGS